MMIMVISLPLYGGWAPLGWVGSVIGELGLVWVDEMDPRTTLCVWWDVEPRTTSTSMPCSVHLQL